MNNGDATKDRRQAAHAYGMQAEQQAAQYLQREGYAIVAHRYRNAYGEIDLIARKGDCLCFIEVKARRKLEDGLYALTPRQQKRLVNCALGYVAEHPAFAQCDMRFDLIAIAGWQLQHETHIVWTE